MATMTITTSGAEDTRLAVAYGTYLGLPGNASAAQIKAEIIRSIVAVVQTQEVRALQNAVTPPTPVAPI